MMHLGVGPAPSLPALVRVRRERKTGAPSELGLLGLLVLLARGAEVVDDPAAEVLLVALARDAVAARVGAAAVEVAGVGAGPPAARRVRRERRARGLVVEDEGVAVVADLGERDVALLLGHGEVHGRGDGRARVAAAVDLVRGELRLEAVAADVREGRGLGAVARRRRPRGLRLVAGHALVVLLVVLLLLGGHGARVEVLELAEGLPLVDEPLDRRRVLARAVPGARRVAEEVRRVLDPVLGLLGHLLDLEDADLAVLGRVRGLPAARVEVRALAAAAVAAVGRQLVEQRLGHGRRRPAALVEAEVLARRVVRAEVVVDRVADARHVGRLGQVVAAAARPDQDVVRQVAHDLVRGLFRGREAPA
mmetsp:Transcript_8685/g.29745  ORF Transcript_8685/g.29745 Transcript_8685/m.29745 type:complete len:364 (+) Transcript_8685:3-1094(+)